MSALSTLPKAVFCVSFKLKKGASVQAFLQSAETLNKEYMLKRLS